MYIITIVITRVYFTDLDALKLYSFIDRLILANRLECCLYPRVYINQEYE